VLCQQLQDSSSESSVAADESADRTLVELLETEVGFLAFFLTFHAGLLLVEVIYCCDP